MYSIEVHLPENKEKPGDSAKFAFAKDAKVIYLISKCFPPDASKQDLHIKSNFFYKEYSFYNIFVRELVNMQKGLQLDNIIQPAFPPLVAGKAIDFFKEKVEPGKNYNPFDNYVMMVDLRKTYGYRLFDRLKSYDRAHVSLLMDAMARNHSLSWIYKQQNNITDITTKYPFIKTDFSDKHFESFFTDLLLQNGDLVHGIVKSSLGEESPVVKGLQKFVGDGAELFQISYAVGRNHMEYQKIMRVAPEKQKENNDVPWNVVVQGDCWSSNMLFRYNEVTGEPEEAILVDLQFAREACPTTDIAHMIYTSTDSEFRKEHLEDMLELYAEKFSHYCQMMNSELLPGFSQKELKRRFHNSKPFGLCLGILALPMILIEKEMKREEVENVESGKSVAEMLSSLSSAAHSGGKDSLLTKRVVGLCQDMYSDGII